MKKLVGFLIIVMVIGACHSSKPYYKTKAGKKKQKHYNELQFGGKQ